MRNWPSAPASWLSMIALLAPAPVLAAWPTSPYVNVPVCSAPGLQLVPQAIPDASGGWYIGWDDRRSGEYRVYVQRIDASGSVVAGWPAGGLRISDAGQARLGALVLGSNGSVYVATSDFRADNATSDIYAMRVEANGTFAPGWPVNGLALSTQPGRSEGFTVGASDGAGGAYFAWRLDFSSTDHDIYASRVVPSGVPPAGFPLGGVSVVSDGADQLAPAIVADGAGAAIITWRDKQGSGGTHYSHYGRKLLANGSLAWGSRVLISDAGGGYDVSEIAMIADGSGGAFTAASLRDPTSSAVVVNHIDGLGNIWFNPGVQVRFATNVFVGDPALASDGNGGVVVAWTDYRNPSYPGIYASRVLAGGGVAWTPEGVSVVGVLGALGAPHVIPDAAKGAIVTWTGSLIGESVWARAQRLGPMGQRMWGESGTLVGAAAPDAEPVLISPDGQGGALLVWTDSRSVASQKDVYAQRIDAWGALGDATPHITRIADVPNDQGGQVSLQWTASTLDTDPDRVVANYSIWRRVPGGTLPPRARALAAEEPTPTKGAAWRASREGAEVVFWEYVTTKPAAALPGYSAVIGTTSDSASVGNPLTSLRVRAETADGGHYWDSAPDSGYSVDNLPPLAPAPFTGTYSAGSAYLSWATNAEPDFAVYELHRGLSSNFTPSPATLVVETPSAGYVDPAGSPYWYMLAARDVHGNRSTFLRLLPNGVADAPPVDLPARLSLAVASANPGRGESVLRFGLPAPAQATLAVFDAASRRVRTLATGPQGAGWHLARWDGTTDAGTAVAPGQYFVRLSAGGGQRTVALVRVR